MTEGEPGLWAARPHEIRADGGPCCPAYVSISPPIFIGGLAATRVCSQLDRHDFVRLLGKWVGTSLRDSTKRLCGANRLGLSATMRPHRPPSVLSNQQTNEKSSFSLQNHHLEGIWSISSTPMWDEHGKRGRTAMRRAEAASGSPRGEAALSETCLFNVAGRGGRYSCFPHPYKSAAQSFCTWLSSSW
jgi:hypothetical protein